MSLSALLRASLPSFAAVFALAAPASGQSGPTEWYAGGFAGVEKPLDIDGFFVDSNGPAILSFFGVESELGFEVGGDVGMWRVGSGRHDWGLRAEYGHSRPDEKDDPVHILGFAAGETFDVVDSIGQADVKIDRVVADFLLRWRNGTGEAAPHGRFNLFGGVGAGVEWLRLELEDGAADRDSSPMYRVVAGVELFLTRRLAVGGEYRYTKADHDLLFRTGLNTGAQRGHHLVASIGFHCSE